MVRQWKNFLKGFFDASEGTASVLVTGSARLDIYKRGGDSLMGRYFLYRMHPLSVGELIESRSERSYPSWPEESFLEPGNSKIRSRVWQETWVSL